MFFFKVDDEYDDDDDDEDDVENSRPMNRDEMLAKVSKIVAKRAKRGQTKKGTNFFG